MASYVKDRVPLGAHPRIDLVGQEPNGSRPDANVRNRSSADKSSEAGLADLEYAGKVADSQVFHRSDPFSGRLDQWSWLAIPFPSSFIAPEGEHSMECMSHTIECAHMEAREILQVSRMDVTIRLTGELPMDISSKIRVLREARGFSVAKLAKESGVSIPYIQHIESGRKRNPTAEVLRRLSIALGTTVSDILGASLSIGDDALQDVPEGLNVLVRKRAKQIDLRPEDIDVLKRIHYRGRQPATPEDWELLFLLLRKLLA